MGKRTSLPRIPRDAYDSVPEVLAPLLPHLQPGTRFIEPAAGRGALIDLLEEKGHVCVAACDIEPRRRDIARLDAMQIRPRVPFDCWITNIPWKRKIAHPMIEHLSDQAPLWTVFDANWAFTKQARPFRHRLRKIVTIGRVKWFPGSPYVGMEDAAWLLFTPHSFEPTTFEMQP